MYCGSIWVNKPVRWVRVGVMFTNSDPSYVTARVWLQLGSGYRLDFSKKDVMGF